MKTSIKCLILLPLLLASCAGNQPKNVQEKSVKSADDTFHYVLELPQEELYDDEKFDSIEKAKFDSIYAEQERRKCERLKVIQSENRSSVVERSIERADSVIGGSFDLLTTSKIQRFLDVGSEASLRHGKAQRDKMCDRVVQLIFDEYFMERDRKPYLVLPPSIEVEVYDKVLDVSVGYVDYREKAKNPVTIYLYIPHLKTQSKVLYHFNAATRLLDSYIGRDSEKKSIVKEYLNIRHTHLYGWGAGDFPIFHGISVFNNGVVAYFSTSIDHSEIVFIPKGKDEIVILSWIDDNVDIDEYIDE